MTRRRWSPLLLALCALLGSFLLAAPAHGADKVITITAKGVSPKALEVAAGDTITFVNEDTSFGYRAQATSDNWDLDSGPVGLLPGRRYTHPDPITEAGTYTYRVAEGAPYEGSVLLRGANSVKPPSGKPSGTAPKPPSSSAPAPSPSPTGTAQPADGFGTLGAPSSPAPGGIAPPPAIALPELPGASAGPLPEAAPDPEVGEAGPLAVPGRLSAPGGYRGYGLPAALAVVLAAGVASLLVRLLLAEPAGRRRARSGMGAPAPVATVD